MRISTSVNNSMTYFIPREIKSIGALIQLITTTSYSLGVFHENKRNLKNFIKCDTIGLDIDNEDDVNKMSLDDAKVAFSHYKHIILTTRSHQKEKNGRTVDRFRVILFLESPITTARQFGNTWYELKQLFPAIDPACKDASRFWYASPTVVSMSEHGELIKPASDDIPKARNTVFTQVVSHNGKGKLSRDTWTFIQEGAPSGHWNRCLFKAAKDMQEQLYTLDETLALLSKAAELPHNSGALDEADVKTIESAFTQEPKYEPRRDYNERLREIILECKLIIDQSDNANTSLVNLRTGQRFDISKQTIANLLDKKEYSEYVQYNQPYAAFMYNPFAKTMLYEDEMGMQYYNTYTPPYWLMSHFYNNEPLESDEVPEIVERFFKHLTDDDADSISYIYDWIAIAIQDRNYTMLTAIGDQGIGKGVLGELLSMLFGESNFKKTRDEVFKKSFNAQLENKKLVYIDELALASKEAHDRMKDMVNDTIEIEAKGKDAKTIRNYASFYLSSNHIDALNIEPDDRRISAIELTDIPLLKVFTRDQIEKELLSVNTVEKFGKFLYNRDVERDMRIPFRSVRFNEMLEATLKNWQRFLLYDFGPLHINDEFKISEIQDILKLEFPKMNPPGLTPITKLAKAYPRHLRMFQSPENRSIRMIKFLSADDVST